MGEYAELALASAMRRGIPYRPYAGKPDPTACPLCERSALGGFMGIVGHLKSTHGLKDSAARKEALHARAAIAMEARQRRDAEERPDPKDDSAGRRHRSDTPSLQTPQGGDS